MKWFLSILIGALAIQAQSKEMTIEPFIESSNEVTLNRYCPEYNPTAIELIYNWFQKAGPEVQQIRQKLVNSAYANNACNTKFNEASRGFDMPMTQREMNYFYQMNCDTQAILSPEVAQKLALRANAYSYISKFKSKDDFKLAHETFAKMPCAKAKSNIDQLKHILEM